MKKLILIIMVVMMAAGLNATNKENANYVTSNGKTYICKNVKVGTNNTKVIMENGEKQVLPTSSIDSYMHKGRLFERIAIVSNGKETSKTIFMENIATREGLKLYKYCTYNEEANVATGSFKSASPTFSYYVFKDGKFHLSVDQTNAASTFAFFGIEPAK